MYGKQIGMELRELNIYIARLLEKEAKNKELPKIRGPQAMILDFIYNNQDKVIYQKDIENRLSIRKPTATQILNRMEENGYVKRLKSESDKRCNQIELTTEGEEIIVKVHEMLDVADEKISQNLTPEQVTEFIDTIQILKQNLKS